MEFISSFRERERETQTSAHFTPEKLADVDIREEQTRARKEIVDYARALADELRGKKDQGANGVDSARVKEDILRSAEAARSSMRNITVKDTDPVILEFAVEAVKAETQALEAAYKSEVVRPEIVGCLQSLLPPSLSEDTLEKFERLREITIDVARVGQGKLALTKKHRKRGDKPWREQENGAENYARAIGTALDTKFQESSQRANRVLAALLYETQDETLRAEAEIAFHALFQQALNFGLTLDKNLFGFRDQRGGRCLTQQERERLLSEMDAHDSVKTRISQVYEGLYALESWAETIGDSLDALAQQDRADSANAAWQFVKRHKKPILIGIASLIALGGGALIVPYFKNADHAPTDDGISPDVPPESGVSLSPSPEGAVTPQQRAALAPETRLPLNPLDAAKENFTNFIANTAATAGLESQIAPRVDELKNTIQEKAQALAKLYITEFQFPQEFEEWMVKTIATYCEQGLTFDLGFAASTVSDELLLQNTPSDALKNVFQRFENNIRAFIERFEASPESIAFFHHPVITKGNMQDVPSYQMQLGRVRNLLSDSLPRDEKGAALMGADVSDGFQDRIGIVKFDERDFPLAISAENAEAAKEAERALEPHHLDFEYVRAVRFDAESYPSALFLSNKDRVVLAARSLMHEYLPGKYTNTKLSRRYLDDITFDPSELPVAIDADFSNVARIIDAALALGGMPSERRDPAFELQRKYVYALSFPQFTIDGSLESLKNFYALLKKLSDALAACGLTGYEHPLRFYEQAHKNISVAGPIPVTAETAEYLALIIYHYLGPDFQDHYIIGNQDAARDKPIVYEFSPRDFPLEWNWDDLSLEKLERVSPPLVKAWLEALSENAPIKNTLPLELGQPLPERARKIINALFHAKEQRGPKTVSFQTTRIKRLSDIFSISARDTHVVSTQDAEARRAADQFLARAEDLDAQVFYLRQEDDRDALFPQRDMDTIGSFRSLALNNISLSKEAFPTRVAEDSVGSALNSAVYLKGIDSEIAKRYVDSLEPAFNTRLESLLEKNGKLSAVDVARSVSRLEGISYKLADKYLASLDTTALRDSKTGEPSFVVLESSVDKIAGLFLTTAYAGERFQRFLSNQCVRLEVGLATVRNSSLKRVNAFLMRCGSINPAFARWSASMQELSADENQLTPESYDAYALYAQLSGRQFTRGEINIAPLIRPVRLGEARAFIETGEKIEHDFGTDFAEFFRKSITVDIKSVRIENAKHIEDFSELLALVDRYGEYTDERKAEIVSIPVSERAVREIYQNEQALMKMQGTYVDNRYVDKTAQYSFLTKIVSMFPVSEENAREGRRSIAKIDNATLQNAHIFLLTLSLMERYIPAEQWKIKNVKPGDAEEATQITVVALAPPVCQTLDEYMAYYTRLLSLEKLISSKSARDALGKVLLSLSEKNKISRWSAEVLALRAEEIGVLKAHLNDTGAEKNSGDKIVLDIIADFVSKNPVTRANYKTRFELGKKFFDYRRDAFIGKDEQGFYQVMCNFLLAPVSELLETADVSEDIQQKYAAEFALIGVPFNPEVSDMQKARNIIRQQGPKGIGTIVKKAQGKLPEKLGFTAEVESAYRGASLERREAEMGVGDQYALYEYRAEEKMTGQLLIPKGGWNGAARFDYYLNTTAPEEARKAHSDERPVVVFTGGFEAIGGVIPDFTAINGEIKSLRFSNRDGMVIFYPDGTVKLASSSDLMVGDIAHNRISTTKTSAAQGWAEYIPDQPLRFKKNSKEFLLFKDIIKKEGISMFQGQLLVHKGRFDITGKSDASEANRRAIVQFEDGKVGVFNWPDAVNLLTLAHILSPTNEDGSPKPDEQCFTSPDGAKVMEVVNCDTGGQNVQQIYGEVDGKQETLVLGESAGANNLITFVERRDASAVQIVTREAWGARPPREGAKFIEYGEPLEDVLRFIVIHHSAFNNQPGPRELQNVEMDSMGFDDIGYHFIIDANGTIYEGRPLTRMGAHAGQSKEANELANNVRAGKARDATIQDANKLDPDYGAIGIVLDGNFEGNEPSREQLAALNRLCRKLQSDYHIPRGNIIGHREVKEQIVEAGGLTFTGPETVCPGEKALPALETMLRSLPAGSGKARGKIVQK